MLNLGEKPVIQSSKDTIQIGDTLTTQYTENIVWYRDSAIVSYDPILIVDQPGNYYAAYETSIFKIESDPIIIHKVITKTEGEEAEIPLLFKECIKVFPNPTEDLLSIELNNRTKSEVIYEIIPLQNHIILKGSYHSNKENIDISSLKSGIYLLKIVTQSKYYLHKIVKL